MVNLVRGGPWKELVGEGSSRSDADIVLMYECLQKSFKSKKKNKIHRKPFYFSRLLPVVTSCSMNC